jgi:hypothetical protein
VLQERPRRLQISKYIFFPSVLNWQSNSLLPILYQQLLRRTHTQELVTHLTFVKKERVHNSFNIFSLGGGGSSSIYLSVYLSIWGNGFLDSPLNSHSTQHKMSQKLVHR